MRLDCASALRLLSPAGGRRDGQTDRRMDGWTGGPEGRGRSQVKSKPSVGQKSSSSPFKKRPILFQMSWRHIDLSLDLFFFPQFYLSPILCYFVPTHPSLSATVIVSVSYYIYWKLFFVHLILFLSIYQSTIMLFFVLLSFSTILWWPIFM